MEAEVAPAGAPVAPGVPPTPTTSGAAAPSTSTLPEYARGLNNYVMPSTPQDQGIILSVLLLKRISSEIGCI